MQASDLTHWLTLHARLRGLGAGTVYQYELALRDLADWSHGQQRRSLTECDVIDWVLSRVERGAGAKTARNNLASVLAIWETASELGHCQPPDRRRLRLLRLRWQPPRPDSWSIEQVRAMLAACDRMTSRRQRGPLRGCTYGQYLAAMVRLGLDTGLRRGDLWRVSFADVARGQWWQQMAKTGHYVACACDNATQAAVGALSGVDGRTLVFGRICDSSVVPVVHPNTHHRHWLAMLRLAGLPASRREGLQKLRRTSATWAELLCPGAAREHLGHASPAMAERHYVDRLALAARPVVPGQLLQKVQ